MDAKQLHDALSATPTSGTELAALAAENMSTILRALSLLAAAEANDGTTPETDAEALDDDNPYGANLQVVPADFARHLERERNGLAAEVLRLQEQLQSAEKEAHRKDVLLVEAIYGQPCPTQRQWEQMQELVAKAFASRGKP